MTRWAHFKERLGWSQPAPPPEPTVTIAPNVALDIAQILERYRDPAYPETFTERYRRTNEERTRLRAERAVKQQKEWAEAEAKAQKLLHDHLTPQQRKHLDERGYFLVKGRFMTYRVGASGRVQLDKPPKGFSGDFCVGPVEPLPMGDRALTVKLWIEASEAAFLGIANPTWIPGGHIDIAGKVVPRIAAPNGVPVGDPLRYNWDPMVFRTGAGTAAPDTVHVWNNIVTTTAANTADNTYTNTYVNNTVANFNTTWDEE